MLVNKAWIFTVCTLLILFSYLKKRTDVEQCVTVQCIQKIKCNLFSFLLRHIVPYTVPHLCPFQASFPFYNHHSDLILNEGQIAFATFDLDKDKRSLSIFSHYQLTDNAAPSSMPKSSNCWNWSHMWIPVVLQNTFPRLGRARAPRVSRAGIGAHTLQANAESTGRGAACIVYMAHAIHLYSWGFVRRKARLLWL